MDYTLSNKHAEDANFRGSTQQDGGFSVALWKWGLSLSSCCVEGDLLPPWVAFLLRRRLSRILFCLRKEEIQRPPTETLQLCVYWYLVAEQGTVYRCVVSIHLWWTCVSVQLRFPCNCLQRAALGNKAWARVHTGNHLLLSFPPPSLWQFILLENSLTYSNTFHWWQLLLSSLLSYFPGLFYASSWESRFRRAKNGLDLGSVLKLCGCLKAILVWI